MMDKKLVQFAFIWEDKDGQRETRSIDLDESVKVDLEYSLLEDDGKELISIFILQNSLDAKALKSVKDVLNE